jgi:hypothetical protein
MLDVVHHANQPIVLFCHGAMHGLSGIQEAGPRRCRSRSCDIRAVEALIPLPKGSPPREVGLVCHSNDHARSMEFSVHERSVCVAPATDAPRWESRKDRHQHGLIAQRRSAGKQGLRSRRQRLHKLLQRAILDGVENRRWRLQWSRESSREIQLSSLDDGLTHEGSEALTRPCV